MMNARASITLTPAAQRWAIKHGGAITLRLSRRYGCCGGIALVPVAEIGLPQRPQEYLDTVVDYVQVFHTNNIALDEDKAITIDIAGLWRWRRLVVEGLEMTAGHMDHEKKG